jgi:hypothetical protein
MELAKSQLIDYIIRKINKKWGFNTPRILLKTLFVDPIECRSESNILTEWILGFISPSNSRTL